MCRQPDAAQPVDSFQASDVFKLEQATNHLARRRLLHFLQGNAKSLKCTERCLFCFPHPTKKLIQLSAATGEAGFFCSLRENCQLFLPSTSLFYRDMYLGYLPHRIPWQIQTFANFAFLVTNKYEEVTPKVWVSHRLFKSEGCRTSPKHFHISWNVSYTEYSENAQLFQHLKLSNSCNRFE